MEKIKIYDASLREIGIDDRDHAHENGEWHKVFHCWICNSDNRSILFQLRSAKKTDYPSVLDISAAGHLQAHEDIQDGIREVSEELGIDVPFSNLYDLGYRVEVDDTDNGRKNREYQAVFLANIRQDLSYYSPQKEEVAGLYWLNVDDALDLFSGNGCEKTMWGITYDSNSARWRQSIMHVSIGDFLPRIQHYYLTIAIMCERLFANKFPLAIS